MALRLIANWAKHREFVRELYERCAAEALHVIATDGTETGKEIVARVEAKMLAEGWDPGFAE